MLLEPLLILWLSLFASAATTRSADSVNPLSENSQDIREGKKIQKRQYPWDLPQAFPNLVLFPSAREGWRYYPCRSYPPFPAYPPSSSLPPSTPPSSPSDDPNDILDRMAGGEGKKNKDEPSRCVWAVVACCSPGSRDIRYSCFELLGCPGAFWDVNPCEEKVVMAAANSALNFYSGKNSTETTTAAPN